MKNRQLQLMKRFGGFDDFMVPFKNENFDFLPKSNIIKNENEYLIEIELPGVDKKDIKVSINKGILSISGEKSSRNKESGDTYTKIESSYGKFERNFTLDDSLFNIEGIESKIENGLLEIKLPLVKEVVKTEKLIEIK